MSAITLEPGTAQEKRYALSTGRENDGAQGGTGGGELYYYRARYYDPVLKRFISSDPIGLAGGLNTYGYVERDPVNYFDPDGLAKSGRPVPVGTSTVRVDPNHNPNVPGQEHAHVKTPGEKEIIINKDGTTSHKGKSGDPSDIPKKAKDYLRGKGFNIPGLIPLICPLCTLDPFLNPPPSSCEMS